MSLDKIYLLPQTILVDVDEVIQTMNKKKLEIKVKDIYNMIKQRYKGRLQFTKQELQEFINERLKEINAPTLDEAGIVPLPVRPQGEINSQQDEAQDNSPTVNVRNKASVLEFFKNKIMSRIRLIETQQTEDGRIDPYMEALVINYTKEMHNIIEKEIKLQLEVEESSKLEVMVEDRLSMLFMLIKSVIQKHTDEKAYEKIMEDFNEIFEVYNMEKINGEK